jgi:hypothetical protein
MENLKFSVFDIFAYLLPGAAVLTAIVLFSTPNIADLSKYFEMTKNISLGLGVLVVFISYMIGNVIDTFGSWLYYNVGYKIWGNSYLKNEHPTLSHAKQRALVREYSPENFLFIHTWKVLKRMSHNLSIGMLLLAIASCIKYIQYHVPDWIIISIVSIVSATVFLHRASVYDKWHYKELLETIEVLRLEQRGGSVSLNKTKSVKQTKNA